MPVAAQVVIAAASLVVVVVSLVAAPGVQVANQDPRAIIGSKELVRITGPTGRTVEAIARVDTGATSTSIDQRMAEDLGFDLQDATRSRSPRPWAGRSARWCPQPCRSRGTPSPPG